MLTGDADVVLTIRFSTAPGVQPEQAAGMISNNIGIPLGLTPHIRQVDINVIPATTPLGSANKPKLV